MTALNVISSKMARKTTRQWWREYRSTALFLFFMLMFRSAWADWVSVPTGSMNPTIIEGDRVVVDKHVYGLRLPWTLVRLTDGRDPRRGEIVVFDSPTTGISLVKRVIGVPGDVIALDEGGLVVNGEHARYSSGDVARIAPLLGETRARQPMIYREEGVVPAHDILRMPFAVRGSTCSPSSSPTTCISCSATTGTTARIRATSASFPGGISWVGRRASRCRSIRKITGFRAGIGS
jgi:signal peptidase I